LLKNLRVCLPALNLLTCTAVFMWVYSSYRYDALNIGGATGNINFWILMGDIGFYSTIPLWVLSIVVAIWQSCFEKNETKLRRFSRFIVMTCCAPIFAYGLNWALNVGVRSIT
jgi:hypothetical protein